MVAEKNRERDKGKSHNIAKQNVEENIWYNLRFLSVTLTPSQTSKLCQPVKMDCFTF